MILYVHPKTDLFLRELIPMSVPALMNRLRRPVLGRFHSEWTRDEVREARLILLDIHWYLSLGSALRLSRRFKQINPRALVVAGGLSAGLYARQILRDGAFDYIIRGDAEQPLEMLAEHVFEGAPLESVPNLVGRDFESKHWYSLTDEDLNASDFRTISWFPTLEKRVAWLHRVASRRLFPVHPFLMVYRGCNFDCDYCYGSRQNQQNLFRRKRVLRAVDRVREDLEAWSGDPAIRFVNIYHDFVTVLPREYTHEILNRRYRFNVEYELYAMPSEDQMGRLLNAFEGGCFQFCLDKLHTTSKRLSDPDKLIARIKDTLATKRFEVKLCFVGRYCQEDPAYAAAFKKVYDATGASPYRVDYWWEDGYVPDSAGYGVEKDYVHAPHDAHLYRTMNLLFRASVQGSRFAPRFTQWACNMYNRLGPAVSGARVLTKARKAAARQTGASSTLHPRP